MRPSSICVALLAVASLRGAGGCSRQNPEVAAAHRDAPLVAASHDDASALGAHAESHTSTAASARVLAQAPLGPSTLNAAPLPEDPEAGKRAEAQWREHLEKEEEERQVGFDRRRLKQHRALIRRINAARARIQAARTPAAIEKLQRELPRQLEPLRQGIQQVDPWGVTSRLLPDYKAVTTLLDGPLVDAKAQALRGQPAALAEANHDLDERLEHMKELLEEAAESEETY